MDAKLEFSRNGRNREIQYGRHPEKKVLDFFKNLIYQKIQHNLLIKKVSWVGEPGPFQMPEKNQFLFYYLY